MKIEGLFSGRSHLSFSLVFTGLAFLVLALNLPSLPQNPGLLSLITAIFGTVIFCTSLALNRRRWLIAPFIGIAVTLVSALYSTTVYPVIPCGSIQVSQGFPYTWIRRFSLSPNSPCPLYLEPIIGGLPEFSYIPRTIIAYTGFITDIVFYTLITLAIFELAAATRRFPPTSEQQATVTDHARISLDDNIEKGGTIAGGRIHADSRSERTRKECRTRCRVPHVLRYTLADHYLIRYAIHLSV